MAKSLSINGFDAFKGLVMVTTLSEGILIYSIGSDEKSKSITCTRLPSDFEILMICHNDNPNQPIKIYKKTCRFKSFKNVILELSDILTERNRIRVMRLARVCSECKSKTIHATNLCIHCHYNFWSRYLTLVASIPVLGFPFSLANVILLTARANHSKMGLEQAASEVGVFFLNVLITPKLIAEFAVAMATQTLPAWLDKKKAEQEKKKLKFEEKGESKKQLKFCTSLLSKDATFLTELFPCACPACLLVNARVKALEALSQDFDNSNGGWWRRYAFETWLEDRVKVHKSFEFFLSFFFF